jgi:regulator of protease activity HflC (stomatin/prohibitin superfamily)
MLTVVLLALILLLLLTLSQGIRTVPQGQVWMVERFGAYRFSMDPGLHLILPFVDRVGLKMSVQEIVLDIPEQAVITKDNAAVAVDGIVYYRVLDPVKAAYGAQNLVLALTSMAMTNIRSVIGSLELDAALSERDHINGRLLATLDQATDPWGVKIARVELRKIEPPQNLVAAMNLQMTAEREKRATIAKAQGEREAEIARAEGAKQARVLQAEGELEAARRQAEARERLAEAEAKATRVVALAAAGEGAAALSYFVSTKYVEALAGIAANPGGRTLILPVEGTTLVGAVTQALEAVRFASPAPPSVPPPPVSSVPQVGPAPG